MSDSRGFQQTYDFDPMLVTVCGGPTVIQHCLNFSALPVFTVVVCTVDSPKTRINTYSKHILHVFNTHVNKIVQELYSIGLTHLHI